MLSPWLLNFTGKQSRSIFYPGRSIPTPQQLFLILWLTLTSGVKALNRPTTKAVLFWAYAQRRDGQAAFSVQSFQHSLGGPTSFSQLSTCPRCMEGAPPLWGETVYLFFFFMVRIKGLSPSRHSLHHHASCTKLLRTASPWLPLALSICLPSAWRALEL